MNTRDGERVSTALAYLPAGRPWPNLAVRCGTEAAGLLVEGGHVTPHSQADRGFRDRALII